MDIITIELEDGEILNASIEGYFDFENKDFIVLKDIDSADLFIYEMVNQTEDDFEIKAIEDEDLLERVIEELERIIEE